jgi:CheY-like chemotaxis protein
VFFLNAGYEVVCAVDGESALRFARDEQPDLTLLDMILPKMGGPEVLQHLKADPVTAGIPVVVSSLSEKNKQKLMEAGAEDYLRTIWRRMPSCPNKGQLVGNDAGECDLPN